MTHKGKSNPFYGKTFTKKQLEKKSKYIYTINFPDGHNGECRVLTIFCKENNLNNYKLKYESSKGRKYKGYYIQNVKRG